jgi:hypothetical protein
MARTRAGYKYPHATTDARPHDHRMCRVIEVIAGRATAGAEAWGTIHHMPPIGDEQAASRARARLFNARNCPRLAIKYGQLSVSVHYTADDGTTSNERVAGEHGYVLAVRVYPRAMARSEIVRRVRAGQPLAYNARKETA